MDAECEKQLLRNIDCTSLHAYLTPPGERTKLGYHKLCTSQVTNREQYKSIAEDCVGLSCETVLTDVGPQLSRVCLVDVQGKVLLDQWFRVKEGTIITDFNTHITGTTSQKLQEKSHGKNCYQQSSKDRITKLIDKKVVVGHDLVNCINLLNIQHQVYIDTVSLMPHHFGFPYKNRLKDLAYEYLKKYLQWGPPDTLADTAVVLQIVRKHIEDGRGTIQIQPCPFVDFKNNGPQIIKAAELDINRVLYFVLRGSRSLGLEVEQANYRSDWDYILVYETCSILDGRLVKLPNIDISFFDKASFLRHLQNNDISYIESFFLDKKHVFVNRFEFPQIELGKLRDSLGFHLNKCKLKSKRFLRQIDQYPSYEWKVLKSYHLGTRFTDLFMQLYEFHKQYIALKDTQVTKQAVQQTQKQLPLQLIEQKKLLAKINIKRMNPLWQEIQSQYIQDKNFKSVCRKLEQILADKQKQCNSLYKKAKLLRHKDQIYIKHSHHRKQTEEVNNKKWKQLDSSQNLQLNSHVGQLQTISFLRKHTLTQLQQKRIICRRHRIYSNLIQLHYQQSANFSDTISRECRGLILDERANFSIVAFPYFKFFDYNDPRFSEVAGVDWKSAKIYEKKDGSFAILYFYAKEWHVASSTVPDGLNNYCFAKKQTTTQFKTEFWSIFYSLGFRLPVEEDCCKTFIFELMSKNHIIVVKRQNSNLCLHGVRDIKTLQQQAHEPYGQKYKWNVSMPLQIPKQEMNMDCLIKRVEQLNPLLSEGYILCDKNWTRVKIKSSSYVRINWLGELNLGFNKDPKKYILMEIILSGQAEIFCQYCPQWKQLIQQYLGKIKSLNARLITIYEPLKDYGQRQYAEAIKNENKSVQAFLFALKSSPHLYYGKAELVMSPKKFYQFIDSYK